MSKEFKPGDRVILNGSGKRGVVKEVVLYAIVQPDDNPLYPATYWCEDLEPEPETPITDAERVAACLHQWFDKLKRTSSGFCIETAAQIRPFLGNTITEALDALVRHLRSTGWRHDNGGEG